jgi:two-component system cell cycle response regulator
MGLTARVLIVDDIAANARLLDVRLTAEYYDVVSAASGPEALAICAQGGIDIVLLDVMMPDMDGFEVARRLKADLATHDIPILMITALDRTADRVRGLECGADDFLTKPVDDLQLMARVKSLVRLKTLNDELRARARTGQEMAIGNGHRPLEDISSDGGNILLIDTDARRAERAVTFLVPAHKVSVVGPAEAAAHIARGDIELALVSMGLGEFDPLRVCSQLRTMEQGRHLPIILMAEESDRAKVVRGLDLGVNDFIMRPIERNELMARVRTQIKRQRYATELRETVSTTMALAVTDELTGLYNRRYFDRHFAILMERAHEQERDLSIMLIDIDFFKSVNDTHGHDVGDSVLREFSLRLRRNIRGVDLACRYGGEEFVVLMPDTDFEQAQAVAERVRSAICERPFDGVIQGNLVCTVSIGVALKEAAFDTPDALLKRADVALYRAKRGGRNRVVFDAA